MFFWSTAIALTLIGSPPPETPKRITTPIFAPVSPERRAIAERLAAADRDATIRRRRTNARRLTLVVRDTTKATDDRERFVFTLRNRTTRPIAHVDIGLTLYGTDGHRLGLTEVTLERRLPAHGSATIALDVAYLAFAEGAPRLRGVAGRPKRIDADIKDIAFADRSGDHDE